MPCFTDLQMKLFIQGFILMKDVIQKTPLQCSCQAKVTSEAPAGSTALECKHTLPTREPTSKQFCALSPKQRLLCSKGHTGWIPA